MENNSRLSLVKLHIKIEKILSTDDKYIQCLKIAEYVDNSYLDLPQVVTENGAGSAPVHKS